MRRIRHLVVVSTLVVVAVLIAGAVVVLHHPARAHAAFCLGLFDIDKRYSPSFGAITTYGGDCFNSEYIGTANGVWIFWTPSTNAHIVWGAIGAHYVQDFWPYSTNALGFPTSDETDVPVRDDNTIDGKFNRFQNGWIFWNPNVGSHAIYGAIGHYDVANTAGPYGPFGWPTTDEENDCFLSICTGRMNYLSASFLICNTTSCNTYQQAYIAWTSATGAITGPCISFSSGLVCNFPVAQPEFNYDTASLDL